MEGETTRLRIPKEQTGGLKLRLLTICETAALLAVSESWVRRHQRELPHIRIGRLIRFDHCLLSQLLQVRILPGKSLRPERNLMLSRYQRGYVYLTGKQVK